MAEKADTAGFPLYMDAKMVRQSIAPLSRRTLNDWVLKGWLRGSKTGTSRQARKVFNTADILEILDRLCRGMNPRRKNRKS